MRSASNPRAAPASKRLRQRAARSLGKPRLAAKAEIRRRERLVPKDRTIGPVRPPSDEMFVLPEQIIAPTRLKLNGVRHLMAAVLTDGVESFCKTIGAVDPRKRALHDETAAWIFSDDRSGLFSFLNLCEALDVDPQAVRDGLTKWLHDHAGGRSVANPGLGWVARLLALA